MEKYWTSEAHRVNFRFARQLTAHHSKSFYFSTRLLPQEKQWATFGLYGFCRYVDNLIDNPRNRSVQELLQEVDHLQQELEIAYRTGESEHPILQPFIEVANRYHIPMEYPVDLLRGVRMDLEHRRYATFDELYLFAYHVAGVVGIMMTYILGSDSPEAVQYAEKLGIALQLTNILRDVKEDAGRNRIYLPLDEMRNFGVTEEEILSGKMTPELEQFMKFQIQRAEKYYSEAQPGIALLETDAQFAIIAASKIYHRILRKIETHDYNPFLGRVFVSQSQKIGILFREMIRNRILRKPVRLIPA